MFATAEVRWFYEGPLPKEVLTWFRDARHGPATDATRVDYYLRLGDRLSLGIKVREGRIEIKQRQGQGAICRFDERVAGRLEEWRKWSFPLAAGEGTVRELLTPQASWLGVRKTRRLRRYRLAGGKRVEPMQAVRYPGQGCDWELTSLLCGGTAWWSLGLEAFGQTIALRECLQLGVEHILQSSQPPLLEAHHSFGYPQWLVGLAAVERRSSTVA
jgi:hypothetical protein